MESMMKSFILFTLVAFTSLFSLSPKAHACLGSLVKLSPTDGLAADGIYGSKGLMITVNEMKKHVIRLGRGFYHIADNDTHRLTHEVEFLGSVADEDRIIQTSYLVNDLKKKTEKVMILKSNYRGDGMMARALPSQDGDQVASKPKKQEGFKSLYSVGCE
jgi:hypothetical protein